MAVPVDRVVLQGVGVPGHRFGVDNFQWLGDEPEGIPLDVDIVPGSDLNRVNIKSQGLLTVAVYGSEDLDVLDIDPGTLAFGPAAEGLAHQNGPHVDDLDTDGFLDLVLHFHTRSTGIAADDAEACLAGATWDGVPAEGCDAVDPND